ncbi:MAG TPA: helix-turn-helix domain-containing protein, partial [Chitinophagaceae bacterium]|nr:helix-turn-helix domain-containing protein [Chitinophagaceae bacterium]
MEQKPVTIKEIARRLNVSVSTVSRALHNHPSIGLRTKTEVQQLAKDLTYEYQSNSNKLAKVTDTYSDPNTKLGDFKDGTNGGDDYTYDVNGNLIIDQNKKILSIIYNYLNLPSMITVNNGDLDHSGAPVYDIITYIYDAGGNKLRKIVNDALGDVVVTKTTTYINGFVYQDDILQFIPHEEGRIRFKPAAGSIPASLQYDYMLKDHLGNVRMVLTEEQQQDKYPVASLEDAKISIEQQYYTINTSNIVLANTVTGLPNYINDNGIGNNPPDPPFEQANSQKLYKLNSNTNKTGLGIALKVMAGDKLDILGKSYYFENNTGGSGANSAIPVLEILNGLI